jgi:hypothetical protein
MSTTAALSEGAIALLRFKIRGYRSRAEPHSLPAYRELTAAGIIEPMPGSETDFRFTENGWTRRQQILSAADGSLDTLDPDPPVRIDVSERAGDLLRRRLAGEWVEVTHETRPLYQELVETGLMIPLHSFSRGNEGAYRLTEAATALRTSADSSPAPSV